MSEVTTRNGIVHGLDERIYHSGPELSSTGARQILESPARFQYNRTHPQPHKDVFDLGTAVHTKVLGVGSQAIQYPPEHITASGGISAKAATVEWANERRSQGLIVLAPGQFEKVDAMAESVLAHSDARAILESIAGREVSLFATVDDVRIRARFDLYDGVSAADLKTARDASPKGFNAAVGRLGYHIQDRFYADAHEAVTGTQLESFKFLAVESTAPYLVGVYDLDFMWEDLAKERVRTARELYRRCMESGDWPGYPRATLTPPTWAIFENSEEEIQV